jgi:hypothetical protein
MSAGVAQGIKALGLNFESFKKQSPVDQIDAIAQAMAEFEDGSAKTAVAVALFGKSGAELIPILNDLAGGAKRNITLTSEQIAAADQFKKSTAALQSRLTTYAQMLSVNAIPTMEALQKTFEDTILSVLGLGKEADKLKANRAMEAFAENTGRAFAFVIDSGDGVIRILKLIAVTMDGLGKARLNVVDFEFAKAKKDLDDMRKAQDDILMRPTFGRQFEANLAAAKKAAEDAAKTGKPNRPTLNISGLSIDSMELKKLADNQVKAMQGQNAQIASLMSERNKFLDMFNAQGLISIRNYYDTQRNILDEATKDQAANYAAQIAVLEKYKRAAFKPSDRADAQGKINDLLAQQTKLQRDANISLTEMSIKEAQAQEDLADAVKNVNAQVLELQGNLGAAAGMKFDLSNEKMLKMFTAEGNQDAVKAVAQLRAYTVAQADINKQMTDENQILGYLQIAEDRIQISRQLGAVTELEALQKLGEARQGAVAQMDAIVEAHKAIADASGNKAFILSAEKAKVALEQLAATADPVADKMKSIFSDSFSDAFSGFIDGTKTATQAFNDFANSIVSQISKIASQKIAQSLFGDMGGSGGVGGIFSFFGSLFGGGKATGGPVAPNSLYKVNERGPEIFEQGGSQYLMTGSKGGNIMPNSGGMVVNNNFAISGQVDRRTQTNIAAEVGLSLQRAMARNT